MLWAGMFKVIDDQFSLFLRYMDSFLIENSGSFVSRSIPCSEGTMARHTRAQPIKFAVTWN